MQAAAWLPLLVKALSTATLVVSASVVAEVLGPFGAALIASLPVSAGPAYLFLALEHGADFVAESALSSLAANAVTGLFLIVYGRLAPHVPPWRSLGAAVLAWLAAGLAMQQLPWTAPAACLLNLLVYGPGLLLLPAGAAGPPATPPAARRRWFELPVRGAAVGSFVALVVGASTLLGPGATGLAAVFPISLISLLIIVRPRIGGPATVALVATAFRAMLGFGLMLLVLHLAIRPWGTAAALLAALAVSLGWSLSLLMLRPRRG